MTQMSQAVAQLRKEIERETAALAEEKTALDAREKMLVGKQQALQMLEKLDQLGATVSGFQTVDTSPTPGLKDAGSLIQLQDLFTDAHRRRTLTDDVRDVVRRFGPQEFTVAHAEAAMKRLGIEVVGKTPRARIALAITKLCEEETLVRTYIGGGNIPHKYRLQAHVSPEDMVGYQAMNHAASIPPREEEEEDDDFDESSSDAELISSNTKGGATK